jgi:hypothetical protein
MRPPEMTAARGRAFLPVDHFDVVELWRLGIQRGARQRGAAAAIEGLGIGEVHRLVPREVSVEGDVEKPALTDREHLGHIAERRRQFAVARHNAHTAGPFGDQHAAVGQESERPGVHQALRDGFDADIAGGGFESLREAERRRQQGGEGDNGDDFHAHHVARKRGTIAIGFAALAEL